MRNVIKKGAIRLLMLFSVFFIFTAINAQTAKTVTGVVVDNMGDELPGATVTVKNSTRGVITDIDGAFSISVLPTDVLVVSFLGFENQEVKIGEQTSLKIIMEEKKNEFDEVTVVAFAKQKKESVISSISTIKPAELKVPVSNLTNALGGRMAGIISYQQSGEPGKDNAKFFIRGVTTFGYKQDPLILIDNVELSSDDLARLNVDDIEQFSIMKDATATALYGARGANGVIFVTTKNGKEGKLKISFRAEGSLSEPAKMLEMSDPITYMKLFNEAAYNDAIDKNVGMYSKFSREKIDRTEAGVNPYAYPAVDWQNELFRDHTFNQRYNLSISGGGKLARYYISANMNQDEGILKNDKLNNFNSNINLKKYGVRSNINIDITKTTELIIRVSGNFDDYTGPIVGGDALFNRAMRTSSVLFPKSFPSGQSGQSTTHILFGNAGIGNYMNPYADMVHGYKESNRTVVLAQVEAKQDLSMLTEGLNIRAMVNTNRYSYSDVSRWYNPFLYEATSYNALSNNYTLKPLNENSGTEYLNYDKGFVGKDITTTNYFEGAVNYTKDINVHTLGAMLVVQMQDKKVSGADSLLKSLSYRNLGLSGRFTYAYDSRYFAEFNFGYNGSERFAKNERFGFFPSIGTGYMISNEKFWDPIKDKVNKLKFKFTYGLVGNDAIGDENDRFFYLSNLDPNGGTGAEFGTNFGGAIGGVSTIRYANSMITWEKSYKMNTGLEIGLFNGIIDIQADYFHDKRENILQERSHISSTMGLSAPIKANIGKATSQGVDFSIDGNYVGQNTFWATARANFTYATNKFDVYEEPDYAAQGTPWNSRIGKNLDQYYGFIAERLFIDENDILNSPKQFGDYRAGDIKYKDINGDGEITDKDKVFMGFPRTPEITYGFGFSMGYKGWDLNTFFQGNARVSLFLEPNKIAPFIDGLSEDDKYWAGLPSDKIIQTGLMDKIANNHWSESNRDPYSFWPRLSTGVSENNFKPSTWWMHDGSFIRLKTVEVGYSLPATWIRKMGMESCRFYLSGNNLLTMSRFKLWDPEMGSNGLNYPLQRVYNLGVNINF